MTTKTMKIVKRTMAALFTVALLCASMLLGGCGQREAQSDPLRVAAMKGPTGMGLAYVMRENTASYTVDLYDAPDAVTAKFINGEIDIAAVPINLASVLYNKTQGEAVLIGVNTLGVLYILDAGDTVETLSDLAGKTLYATGEASTPQYVLEYLLEENGLTDSVTVEYIAEHATLAGMMAAGERELAMLPEPNVSSVLVKNGDVRVALNLTEEWNKVSDTELVQGCYIARRSVLTENAAAVRAFLKDAASSAERVVTDSDAPALIAELGIVGSAAIAEKAVPNCNIVCLTGEEMRSSAEGMLRVLYAANSSSVGGKLPEEDFYFTDAQ